MRWEVIVDNLIPNVTLSASTVVAGAEMEVVPIRLATVAAPMWKA